MVPSKNLQMVRASTFSFDIAVTQDSTGEPVNLTNGTLRFTCKWAYTDPDADAIFTLSTPASGIVIISAAGGTANVTIPSTATSALPYDTVYLYYDLKFTDASDFPWITMRGILTVNPNVTRT